MQRQVYYLKAICADFSVPVSKNTEVQVGLEKHFFMSVMPNTMLIQEHCFFYCGIPVVFPVLNVQTLAWEREESCRGCAAAGCLSLPRKLEGHLSKCMNCTENSRDNLAQELLKVKDPPNLCAYA